MASFCKTASDIKIFLGGENCLANKDLASLQVSFRIHTEALMIQYLWAPIAIGKKTPVRSEMM